MEEFKGSSSGGRSSGGGTGYLIGTGGSGESGESSNNSNKTMTIIIFFACLIGIFLITACSMAIYEAYQRYKILNPNGTFFGMIQQKFSSMFSSNKE